VKGIKAAGALEREFDTILEMVEKGYSFVLRKN
jgi:hypothetical protein